VRLGLKYEAEKRLGYPNVKNFTKQDVAQIKKSEVEPIIIKMDNVKTDSRNIVVQRLTK
jgi:hypothetical protein